MVKIVSKVFSKWTKNPHKHIQVKQEDTWSAIKEKIGLKHDFVNKSWGVQ